MPALRGERAVQQCAEADGAGAGDRAPHVSALLGSMRESWGGWVSRLRGPEDILDQA